MNERPLKLITGTHPHHCIQVTVYTANTTETEMLCKPVTA